MANNGATTCFDDREELRVALAALAREQEGSVTVVVHHGRGALAAHSAGAVRSDGTPLVRLGCLTKLLTAELALEAAQARRLHLDDRAACRDIARRHPRARAITVRQLLEHTHGLDDSGLEAAPRRSNGCIDESALWSLLCTREPIAQPGQLYSYGHAGAWLAAALLERRACRPYVHLLRDFLRRRLPTTAPVAIEGSICPASGGAFEMSAAALLELLRRRALDTSRAWPTETRSGTFGELRPLPGWNPLERAIHVGWKAHGSGWFGHASTWPGASALVRVHPERGLAFLIASQGGPAALMAARVFGTRFPELFDLRPPAGTGRRTAGDDLAPLAGRYGCAAWSIVVKPHCDTLQLQIVDRVSGAEHAARAAARGAGADVFFCDPPLPSFPYVQFLRDGGGTARFLWNGRFVAPRTAP